MIATDATFTASRNAEKDFEFLIFRTSGFSKATNKNDGRNIPKVAIKAPVK